MNKILQAILNYYKQDAFVRITSSLMLLWYLVLRWVVLAHVGEHGLAWLHDPMSAGIFLYTLGYLIVIMFLPKSHQYQLFWESVILAAVQGFCLVLMLDLYAKVPTLTNYNFLILDLLIFAYSACMLFITWKGKSQPAVANNTQFPSLILTGIKYCANSIRRI